MDENTGSSRPGAPRTTRRRLISQALGVVPLVRDRLAPSNDGDEGQGGERAYRTYREGVADLRRRERAAAGSPPPRPAQLPNRSAPRTWREGAAQVAARERQA